MAQPIAPDQTWTLREMQERRVSHGDARSLLLVVKEEHLPDSPLVSEPSRTPTQTRARPLLGIFEKCSLIIPLAGAIATGNGASGVPRAVRAVRLAAARGLGECRAGKEGVDAGGGERPLSRPDVFTAPRGARECPYKAHVRIVSGFIAPDGLRGGWLVRGGCGRSGSPLVAVPAHGPDRAPGPRGMAVWKRANHNRSNGLDRDVRGTLSQKPFRDTCLVPTAVAFRGERVAP